MPRARSDSPTGLWQVASRPITKAELLTRLNKVFGLVIPWCLTKRYAATTLWTTGLSAA